MEEQTQLAEETEVTQAATDGEAQKPPKKKVKLWVKITSITLACIVGVIAILGFAFLGVWHNEISTLSNFDLIRERNADHDDAAVYSMKVKGGYYFDDFLSSGGAKTDAELISFISNHVTRGLIKMNIQETDLGCASFTAVTESGDRLFARNYDNESSNVCITLTNPGGGRHASFSTADLRYLGLDPQKDVEGLMNNITCLAAPYVPLDGINDAGVSCSVLMTYQGEPEKGNAVATDQKDPNKNDITTTTMMRMILDYADDVDEAIELVKKYNFHDSANTSFHYMIADATGKSAILEWVNGTDATDNDGAARELVVTYNTGDDNIGEREGACDFQWVTNFIILPGYYESDDDKAGLDRYDVIYEDLSATNGVVKDEWAAMDLLEKVGRRTYKPGFCVTVHSAIYNLTQKSVLWVSNENFNDSTAIFEYSFATGKLKTVTR
ncbi:MAG: linear amide C-N hydrolase [Clostridiales bacterium]|nr:linear amide C-N hydrolase [Clostridiales bacterium]